MLSYSLHHVPQTNSSGVLTTEHSQQPIPAALCEVNIYVVHVIIYHNLVIISCHFILYIIILYQFIFVHLLRTNSKEYFFGHFNLMQTAVYDNKYNIELLYYPAQVPMSAYCPSLSLQSVSAYLSVWVLTLMK